jgi:hypothetical protein
MPLADDSERNASQFIGAWLVTIAVVHLASRILRLTTSRSTALPPTDCFPPYTSRGGLRRLIFRQPPVNRPLAFIGSFDTTSIDHVELPSAIGINVLR